MCCFADADVSLQNAEAAVVLTSKCTVAEAQQLSSLLADTLSGAGFRSELTATVNTTEASSAPVGPTSGTDDDGKAAAAADTATSQSASVFAMAGSHLTSVMAGLAGSSCCLVQLMLNGLAALDVAHIGCAGFNKLGPLRSLVWLTLFLSLTRKQHWPRRQVYLRAAQHA